MFGGELGPQFPWGVALGWLALSLLSALVLVLVWNVVMMVSLRRFLMGGVAEARIKELLLRYSWLFAIIVAVPAGWLIAKGHTAAGILGLVAAAILALMAVPIAHSFLRDFAVVSRLGAHLWSRRHDIERLQSMAGAENLAEAVGPSSGDAHDAHEASLAPEDRKLRDEVESRFRMEMLVERVMFRGATGVNDLVEEGARQASPGMFEGGTGPELMGAVGEYVMFLLLSIAGTYVWLAMRMTTGVDWQTPLLWGVAAALIIALALPIIRFVRRILWTAPCLVCATGTRQRIQIGAARPHICSETCDRRLRTLFALG